MSREFNWNSGIWRIFLLKGYKHLAVMGLDSRHVILTAPHHHHLHLLPSTPLQRHPKLRLLWIFLTLWNCQSSQWPGQALSLWRWGFKMVPTKQHGRRIWKRHNELEKKKKNPSYLGNKTRGRRENVEERGKRGGRPSSLPSIPQPILSPQSKRQAFLVLRGVTERKAGTHKKRRERKWEPVRKRGGEQERREWQAGEGGESNLNRCHQLRHVE